MANKMKAIEETSIFMFRDSVIQQYGASAEDYISVFGEKLVCFVAQQYEEWEEEETNITDSAKKNFNEFFAHAQKTGVIVHTYINLLNWLKNHHFEDEATVLRKIGSYHTSITMAHSNEDNDFLAEILWLREWDIDSQWTSGYVKIDFSSNLYPEADFEVVGCFHGYPDYTFPGDFLIIPSVSLQVIES